MNPGLARALLPAIVLLALTGCAHTDPLPDDGFVAVPGGRVAFRVTGKSGGVPVLMIHGGPGGTGCSYADTMQGVAASRPVVTYDQLGSGNSDRMLNLERDAVLSRFVAEVTAIRAQLGLQEVHLVGHSWGAAIALEYLLTGDRLPYTDPAGRGLEDMPDYNRPLLQPSLLNYQVDPRLEQIIVRCLAIRPQERYPTARELLADLEAWRPATAPARLPAYEQPSSKAALGPAASPNQSSAESMARRALTLAQSAAGLGEAADLMEEAFNLWPALRSQYEYNVRLWRRGIMS